MNERRAELARRTLNVVDTVSTQAIRENSDHQGVTNLLAKYTELIEADFPEIEGADTAISQIVNSYLIGLMRGIVMSDKFRLNRSKKKQLEETIENMRQGPIPENAV